MNKSAVDILAEARREVGTFPNVRAVELQHNGKKWWYFWIKANARDRGMLSRQEFCTEDGAMNAGVDYLKNLKGQSS